MANKATRYLDKRKNSKGETLGIKTTDLKTDEVNNGWITKHTGTPQTLTGAGAVNITTAITWLVTTWANALTLANGAEWQEKYIVMKTDGGAGTLTPATPKGFATLTFDDVGDSAHLLFTNGGWHFMWGTATVA